MAGKIRLHELAKELGLTNKETLDLCGALGIGVKSHSSSIEEAQADRVRRRAEREGLKRDVQPEEPKKEKAGAEGARPAAAAAAAPAPAPAPTPAPAPETPPAERPAAAAPTPTPAPAAEPRPAAPSAPAPSAPAPAPAPASAPDAPLAPAAAARPEAAPAPGEAQPSAEPEHRVVRSRPTEAEGRPPVAPAARTAPPGAPGGAAAASAGSSAPPRPAAPPRQAPPRPGGPPSGAPRPPAPPQGPPRQAPPGAPPRPPAPGQGAPRPAGPPPGGAPRPGGPSAPPGQGAPRPPAGPGGRPVPPPPGGPPRSASGRPIPPPPGGPLRSASGRPIPPPPGGVGRPSPPGSRPGGPGRPGGGPRPFGGGGPGGGPRPYGGPGGGPRPGGGPGGRPGGPGGGPGGGGRPTGARRAPRRTRRRRRNMEELTPQALTAYTSTDAPVPEGTVVVERGATAQELGPKLNRTAADVVRFLMQQGEMVTATMTLTDDQIELFALELGADVLLVDPGQQEELELQALFNDDAEDDEAAQQPRPPVITVMGHVDHGKTTVLDRIRSANVVAGEAGGITQHIGAYQTEKDGRLITFIDTPGHEAFTKMRARGADATDVVVLVVAADDGVMPQTVEALNHAKAAEVPIVVAVNKIDRENADPQRVMSQLAELGLVPEQWGGDTIFVEMSALQNLGIDDLLEQILLVADLEELTANPDGKARGVVLEANLDVGRGPVATVLVQTGTLRVGDPIVAGAAFGTVRALINDRGEQVKEAGPSTPVQVLGLSTVPGAGDEFRVAPSLKTAKTVAEAREQRQRLTSQRSVAAVTHGGVKLEDIFAQIQKGEVASLNLILKADVQGSLEALTESLRKLERDEVKLAFVHRGVGGITENDIQLAATTNATIIGFNVRPDRKGRELADAEGVEIRTYEIIYQVLEDIEKAMVGMLAPEYEEVVTGDAEVREVFRVPRVGAIAGCYVQNGTITRGSKVRFLRDGTVIWKGTIQSLRRFKDDVREVREGFECGIGLSDFQDLKPGDIIETYEEREIPRT